MGKSCFTLLSMCLSVDISEEMDYGGHFNHFRIFRWRLEEDQIKNGGHGMTPSAIVRQIGSIEFML